MDIATLDTHKAVKQLEQAGFQEIQAEAVVAMVSETIGGNIATKADVGEVRAEMQAMKAELRTEMQAMKAELYRALWVQTGVIIGAVVALVKLLP